jgi:precorrin-6B methylase 2
MAEQWTAEALLELVRGYHPACVLIAGAELDVFTVLHEQPMDAARLATRIQGDPRATAILLDALAAMRLLVKREGAYHVPAAVADLLTETGQHCRLGMVRHQGNCLRRWGQLARVVRSGQPIGDEVSVRGEQADMASFIRAMHEISDPVAAPLLASLGPLHFRHLLDLGGASGTYTIPFLRFHPAATATIFDLPAVLPMAKTLLTQVGLAARVRLVPGDFYTDALPAGADLAWVSAIVHQNSRAQNRLLFAKVWAALVPGGRILIRDFVMDGARTDPPAGAFFAVNMLVMTPGGGTFTFPELQEDLIVAGFGDARLLHRGEGMDSIVSAVKPE